MNDFPLLDHVARHGGKAVATNPDDRFREYGSGETLGNSGIISANISCSKSFCPYGVRELVKEEEGFKANVPTKTRRKKAHIVPREENGIDLLAVSPFAISVCQKLQDAGYKAFIVGGAVRDLLIGSQTERL